MTNLIQDEVGAMFNEDAPAWDIGRDEGPSTVAPWEIEPQHPVWAKGAMRIERLMHKMAVDEAIRVAEETRARAKERADLIAAANEVAPEPAPSRPQARL